MIHQIVPAAPGTTAELHPVAGQFKVINVIAFTISYNVVTGSAEIKPIGVSGVIDNIRRIRFPGGV